VKRTALRWIQWLLVLGACAGLLAVVVHTPWARGLVLHQLTSQLSARTGFVISADALDLSLLRLTATVDGLQVSRPGSQSPPILRVRQARVALSPRILSGAIEAESVEADGVALVIDLAQSTATQAAAAVRSGPFSVPVFTLGRAVVRHADVDVIDADGFGRLKARDATLELEGGGPRRLEGTVVVAGGLMLDNDDTHARIDRFESRAFLDGDTIGLKPVLAVAGAHQMAMSGSLTITGPSPRFDLGFAAEVDVAQLASWFPALPGGSGSVRLEGGVTGPLDDPRLAYSARTTGVTMPDIRLPAATAEGSISRAGIYVDRMRTAIGRGWIEAAGRLPLGHDDPDSRFSLRWADVSIAGLAQVFPLMPKDPIGMVTTGSARVHWPGMALEFTNVAGEVTSDLRLAPHLPPARVGIECASGRWALRGEQELDGGTLARLDA
jgi:hypothetical protein